MTESSIPPFPSRAVGAALVLPRGPGRHLVVSPHRGPEGDWRLDVRVWHWNESARKWEPGRQGVEVRPHEVERFRAAVVAAGTVMAEAESRRRATAGRGTGMEGADDA